MSDLDPLVYGIMPHPPYAEDQPSPYLILTTHVLHRGFQAGSFTGILLTATRATYSLLRSRTTTTALRLTLIPRLQRSVGISGIYGTGLLAVALWGRMRGREEIEWKDRAWRLLENRGQVECDEWSVAGAVVGVGLAVARRGRLPASGGGVRLLGAAGLGNLAGVVGYMGWRYGIRGEKME